MAAESFCRVFAVAIATLSTVGCVVVPMHVYVSDALEGAQVYERCSLTPDLPVGVKLERSGIHAVVSIAYRQGGNQVQVQFDVPKGVTLVLREHTIRVLAQEGGAPRETMIPHINPAAPARYPETPVIERLVLPVDTPLPGGHTNLGKLSFDKHYWIAAPIEGDLHGDVWVSLPEVSVNGTPVRFPEIKFSRRFTIGRALFNC
jgi:hypothetical protein